MPSGAALPSQAKQSRKPVAHKGKQVRNAPWVAKGEHARRTQTQAALPARITCAFHEDGTCALYTVRPNARARRAFPQRFQLTGIHHHNRRESKDDAKPLHNRERWPLRGQKQKSSHLCNFFSIRDSLPPLQSENRQLYGQLSAFSHPDSRFETTQQSLIAKKLQFEPIFCFRAPGTASGRRHGQGAS